MSDCTRRWPYTCTLAEWVDEKLTEPKAIDRKISRRSFIKWSSAVGAAASTSGLMMQGRDKLTGA